MTPSIPFIAIVALSLVSIFFLFMKIEKISAWIGVCLINIFCLLIAISIHFEYNANLIFVLVISPIVATMAYMRAIALDNVYKFGKN